MWLGSLRILRWIWKLENLNKNNILEHGVDFNVNFYLFIFNWCYYSTLYFHVWLFLVTYSMWPSLSAWCGVCGDPLTVTALTPCEGQVHITTWVLTQKNPTAFMLAHTEILQTPCHCLPSHLPHSGIRWWCPAALPSREARGAGRQDGRGGFLFSFLNAGLVGVTSVAACFPSSECDLLTQLLWALRHFLAVGFLSGQLQQGRPSPGGQVPATQHHHHPSGPGNPEPAPFLTPGHGGEGDNHILPPIPSPCVPFK